MEQRGCWWRNQPQHEGLSGQLLFNCCPSWWVQFNMRPDHLTSIIYSPFFSPGLEAGKGVWCSKKKKNQPRQNIDCFLPYNAQWSTCQIKFLYSAHTAGLCRNGKPLRHCQKEGTTVAYILDITPTCGMLSILSNYCFLPCHFPVSS